MQFLHEEFFGKVYGYIKGINLFFIRVLAKLLFWGVIFGILGLLVWFYYQGKINWIFWVVGIFLAAEIAHYLRKSRERKLSMGEEESNNIQDQLTKADVIKKGKNKIRVKNKDVVNEGGLLKKKKVVKKIKIIKEKIINKEGLLKS